MNYTTRFAVLILTNLAMLVLVLFWMDKNGIDIFKSTLMDNVENLRFAFDFLSFLGISFTVNLVILSFPSQHGLLIDRILRASERNGSEEKPKIKRHKPA